MFARSAFISEFPGRWVLYWLILPNLAFILMWLIGGPPMVPIFLRCGIAALVIAQLPWVWVKRTSLVVMASWSTFYYVSTMFNINPTQYNVLLSFLLEVRPMRSPEYFVGAVALIGSIVLALRQAPHVARFTSPMPYFLAVVALMVLLTGDYLATSSTRGSYRGAPPPGTEFASAVQQGGITGPDVHRRHLVIVMVEALGVPTGATEQALFSADWNREGWNASYDVTSGTVPFYGSTTRGEMRELCGRWANYDQVAEFAQECLPARYAQQGYETHAIHGFASSMFDRENWYRQIGFGSVMFRDELIQQGLSSCAGVFEGACDREIPALIGARLKQADAPQLIYFLTLNTHLPVGADAGLGTAKCALGSAEWAERYPQVCRLFLLHHYLAEEIDLLAMDIDLPPTDFLIVGDHSPPFFDRTNRARFDGENVPWVMLRHRSDQPGGGINVLLEPAIL